MEKEELNNDTLIEDLLSLAKKWKAKKYTGDLTKAVYEICAEELEELARKYIAILYK